ncbi:CLIP-associating protein 1-like isoform X3 [Gigantopelta aegis]|uniref:CLIP-associating protein 1-like isoform X3 n=1 Tax=Gigantopelta aegis TaxID=1735272 RepID=UPI001B888904|nr:CLIP-associating protein 1-like isoform X3 [Gigantopelta aegis]
MDLNDFLQDVTTLDTRRRLVAYEELVKFLRDPTNSLDCDDVEAFIDGLVKWVHCSNFKISVNGLEILCLMVDRMGEGFKPHVTSVLPSVIDRLGDTKDQVRNQAQSLLLKLMLPATSPQYVFDRMTMAFSHKQWRVREGILVCLQNTINRYGARCLSLHKLTPNICNLLDDSTPQVREAALDTLAEMYRHVGDRLPQDLGKRNLSSARMKAINARFEEQRQSGNMLPTADLPPPVRSDSRGARDSSTEDEPDSVKPHTFAKPLTTKVFQTKKTPSRPQTSTSSSKSGPARTQCVGAVGNRPKSATSGAVDEEFFMKSFEDVPKIQIFSAKDVLDHLKKIEAVLSNTSNDWEKRNDSMMILRALIVNRAADYDEFIQSLRMLENCFTIAIKDLRSQVVREACITIAYLAKELTTRSEHLVEVLLQPLINLIPNSAKIMSTSGIVCIRFIIQFIHSPRLIPVIANNTSTKSNVLRRYAFEYLNQLLQSWPKHSLERHIALIQECIRRGISDADLEARVFARKAFWGFSHHFKDQADSLLNNLDSAKQKMLQGELSTSSSNNSLNSDSSLKMARPKVRSRSQDRAQETSTFSRNSATRKSTAARISTSKSEASGSRGVTAKTAYVSPYGQTYLMRSSSAVDLSSSPVKSRSNSVQQPSHLEKGSYSSLPRQKTIGSGSKMMSNTASTERSRAHGRIGVSQSQPSSRSGSPSSRLTYMTHGSGRVDPKTPGRIRRSAIPRSQGASREGSREGSPSRQMYVHERRLSGSKVPGRGNKGTILAQRLLRPGSDVEDALSDALARGAGRKRYEYDSDDAASETSSVCSERSYSSYSGRTSEDMQQIIAQMSSGSHIERKEGLISLQQLLRRHRMLSRVELKKVTEIFTRMFHDPQPKVFSMFLDTLVELVVLHSRDLSDWLYVLLTRLIHKSGSDMLGSVQTKHQRAQDAVRDNFPTDHQFNTIAKFIVDQTQSPTFKHKVKIAMLSYLHNLILTMDPSDFVSSIDSRLAVSRIITWTTEPKSVEVRKQAQLVLMALFNLNPPEFSLMLSVMPKTFQDSATKILHSHIGTSASTGTHDVLSPRNATSPPSGHQRPRQQRSSLSYPDDSETENFNPEDIYTSMKKVSADIQNLSIKSKLDHYNDVEKKRDFTSQDSGIQDLRNDSPDGLDGGKKMSHYNPAHYQDENTLNEHNKSSLAEAGFNLESDEARWKTLGLRQPDIPEDQDDYIAEILSELSNHNQRNEQREKALMYLMMLPQEPWFSHWEEHFKSILLILLETLSDDDGNIRMIAINVLREILKIRPHLFKEYAELTILRILKAHKDPVYEVKWAAEACGEEVARAIASEQCMRILNPIGQTSSFPVNLAAIKMQMTVAELLSKEQMEKILPDIVPGLLKSFDDREIRVRKATVFSLVAIYNCVGDVMRPYLEELKGHRMKLLNLYIKKAEAEKEGKHSSDTDSLKHV